MPNSPTGRTSTDGDKPPDASRRRVVKKRLRALFTLASAVIVGAAMMVAAQPASAATNLDGAWTVVHGGTGQILLNADGTYTSTCVAYPNYADAWCPAPSGTFERSNPSYSYVDFHGADGSTTSYRYSGDSQLPDTIDSMFGSRTYSQLEMKKGSQFVCTVWSGTGTSFTRWGISPELEYDAAADMLYATGSHDPVGPKNIDTQVNLAETTPNYFEQGVACPPPPTYPIIRIDSASDASIPTAVPGQWLPQAIVTIKDAAGAPVAGATVNGTFTYSYGQSCVTVADGTCTVSAQSAIEDDSIEYSAFRANYLMKDGMQWDENSVIITVYKPTAPTPTPTTLHIGDLDNATTAASSVKASLSLKAASSTKWQPKVTATVLDSSGVTMAGATVSGTFSHHTGTLTCTTAANGTCTVGNFSLNGSTKTTVFTVTGVAKASSTYAPKANSDPDGDSNGTSITVKRP